MAVVTISDDRPCGADGICRDWEPGDVILDLYEVLRLPGTQRGYAEGGMGRVNLVRHRAWQREIAVKSILPSRSASAGAVEDFTREAEQWVEKIGLHPNVVACFYVRVLGGVPRVFIEFVDGGSLSEWVASKRLYEGGQAAALRRILDVAIQTAWGLHYVHELGLIHQDVKPHNVMMTARGVAKVTDFGLAQAKAALEGGAAPDAATALATWGGMTPAYCSPEQAEVRAMRDRGVPCDHWPKLTRRTDVWSWAVSVLHLFLGKIAWVAGQVAYLALQRDPDEPYLPAMPEAVRELLGMCLRRQPEERPHDLMQVADTLRDVYEKTTGQTYLRGAPRPAELLADTRNNQAVSLIDLKKQEAAEQRWREALEVDPHHPEATYNVGLINWRAGRSSTADLLKMIREARTAQEDDPRVVGLLAQLYLETGYLGRALDALGQICGSSCVHPEVAPGLAEARRQIAHAGGCVQTVKGPRAVSAAAWNADGSLAVSGHEPNRGRTNNDTLWCWDVATGACLRTFPSRAFVHAVALSADGGLALSAVFDPSPMGLSGVAVGVLPTAAGGTLELWETATGRCLREFGVSKGEVQSIALSADGRRALSGGTDGSARLWDVASGDCLRTFDGQQEWVWAVALSDDGRRVLAASGAEVLQTESTLHLWDVSTGQRVRVFAGRTGVVESVSLSADARWALTGGNERVARLWDTATGRCVRDLEGHTDRIRSVALSGDGRQALTGSADGTVRLWEAATGRCLCAFEGHAKEVVSVAFGLTGRAFSASRDRLLKVWRLPADFRPAHAPLVLCRPLEDDHGAEAAFENALETARRALDQGESPHAAEAVRKARAQPGRNRHPQALELWREVSGLLPRRAFSDGWLAQTYTGHTDGVMAVAVSDDGCLALSAGRDQTVRLWDVRTGRCLRTFADHRAWIDTVAMSADGRLAVSNSVGSTLRLWDLDAGRCLRVLEANMDCVRSVALSPDARWALSAGCPKLRVVDERIVPPDSTEASVRLWDIATGRCVRCFAVEGSSQSVSSGLDGRYFVVTCVSFSPDGRYLLAAIGKTLQLWDLAANAPLRTFTGHTNFLLAGSLSLDGCRAVSAGLDKSVRLWEVSTGACVRTFRGHTERVVSAVLSPDGGWVLSGSWDRTIRLWDASTGDCVRTFEGHADQVTSVAFAPDGSFFLSASSDRTVRRWDLDWELSAPPTGDWDSRARPYLVNFLTLHSPYRRELSAGPDRLSWVGPDSPARPRLTGTQVSSALTREGKPSWTDADFARLLDTLSWAGLGWLRPNGVRRELENMVASWQGPPSLVTS